MQRPMIEQDGVSGHGVGYPGIAAYIGLDPFVRARLFRSFHAWNIPHRLVRARDQLQRWQDERQPGIDAVIGRVDDAGSICIDMPRQVFSRGPVAADECEIGLEPPAPIEQCAKLPLRCGNDALELRKKTRIRMLEIAAAPSPRCRPSACSGRRDTRSASAGYRRRAPAIGRSWLLLRCAVRRVRAAKGMPPPSPFRSASRHSGNRLVRPCKSQAWLTTGARRSRRARRHIHVAVGRGQSPRRHPYLDNGARSTRPRFS